MRQTLHRWQQLAVLTALIGLGTSGCVYRMNVQQGNLLDQEQIDQLEVGMTRSQVRFLLGTPMVADSFDLQRWDYVYRLRYGKTGKVDRRHLIVWFDGDKVTKIEEPVPASQGEPKSAG